MRYLFNLKQYKKSICYHITFYNWNDKSKIMLRRKRWKEFITLFRKLINGGTFSAYSFQRVSFHRK